MTRLVPFFIALLAASLLVASLPVPAAAASINRIDGSKLYWNSRTTPPPSIRVGITSRVCGRRSIATE